MKKVEVLGIKITLDDNECLNIEGRNDTIYISVDGTIVCQIDNVKKDDIRVSLSLL